MPVEAVEVEATKCSCEACGHEWITLCDPSRLPAICPNCRSRQWNGKKQVGRRSSALLETMPKPRRTRGNL